MSRVLIVDDEPAIRRLVRAVLARGGHESTAAASAREAIDAVEKHPLDAALVDLGLPDRDGLELVSLFRERGIPTIVLSARTDTRDKVAALDLGAEDYLTKPFDGDELLARLRVALRRKVGGNDRVLEHAGIRIEPEFHRVTAGQRAIELTPREFDLLQTLVEAGGRVITHRALLERVWGPAHGNDIEYLRVAVRAIRRKIEDNPSHPKLIINEPGIGYRLAT